MGKYTALAADVYSVFATPSWLAENIATGPDNYKGLSGSDEYIRVSILPTGISQVNIPRSSSGQLIIDIFVPAGEGLKRMNLIADKLDLYLAGKSISIGVDGLTQFGASSLNPIGNDPVNASLYRGSYSISFNYFGK